ncbi:MAG TPA: FAD-dependent oxidoreductase, partial [Longimicrobium sp.]|uniref:FAD-dependent oxidoreductase n=1 Tax=Longimicrobium sp. TaxID=2029185 RepID=UPI002ED799A0
PVMLAVDDDPEVLQAVSRDLRKRYGDRYRIVRADAGAVALDAIRELKRKNEPLALFLVDQRMPRMTGVEFLEEAVQLYPDAKRALLTAYADTEAAIRAINRAHIDYYLLKPWDPPEETLYPVLDDLLQDWQAGYRPPFQGLRVVGHRWSPEAHALRDFLARNQVPYRWTDLEAQEDPEKSLAEAGLTAETGLPAVVLEDGRVLEQPEVGALAAAVGLRTRAEKPFYELAIVGAGPAGLAAAVYGASEGLRTVMLEREAPGGQAGQSSRIENYLGFPAGLSGADLTRRAVTQARKFGAEILTPQSVASVRIEGPYRQLVLADGSEISCHALLIATGVSYRKLDVPGCDDLSGRGVYYGAAATEAAAYRGQDVYVVGGGNSAGQAAMYFSQYARQVSILVRGEGLAATMSRYLIDQIGETPTIRVLPYTEVQEVVGTDHLERLTLRHNDTGECEQVEAAGLFIFIGAAPRTDWLEGVVTRDRYGYIVTGPELPKDDRGRLVGWPLERDPFLLESSIPGIFVAGDVRANSVKRVASGVGEGAIAVQFIHRYLAEL